MTNRRGDFGLSKDRIEIRGFLFIERFVRMNCNNFMILLFLNDPEKVKISNEIDKKIRELNPEYFNINNVNVTNYKNH